MKYVYCETIYTPGEEPWGMMGVVRGADYDAAPKAKGKAHIPVMTEDKIIVGIGAGWERGAIIDDAWLIEAAKRMEGWEPPDQSRSS